MKMVATPYAFWKRSTSFPLSSLLLLYSVLHEYYLVTVITECQIKTLSNNDIFFSCKNRGASTHSKRIRSGLIFAGLSLFTLKSVFFFLYFGHGLWNRYVLFNTFFQSTFAPLIIYLCASHETKIMSLLEILLNLTKKYSIKCIAV